MELGSLADWFAAAGTLLAFWGALYLARQNDKIKLTVRAGIRVLGRVNKPGGSYVLLRVGAGSLNAPQIVWINVTNIRRRSATVTQLHLRRVPWAKPGFLLTPGTSYSSEFPITLGDGQSADYGWLVPECEQKWTAFRDTFFGLRLHRVCAVTSVGDVFQCKLEKELRELLLKIAKAADRP